jgi:hypothetical protein
MTIVYSIADGREKWLERWIASQECALTKAQDYADRFDVPVYVHAINKGGCRTGMPQKVEPRRRARRRAR